MKAWSVWITGLPGSGKSSIAHKVQYKLNSMGILSYILSTDSLRKVMTPKPTYSKEERKRVYATLVYIAKILYENGVNVIIDATGNLNYYRNLAKKELPKFALVYVRCPLEICIIHERERKESFNAPEEIYQKAFVGKSNTVPGINVPYEEPLNADVIVDSDKNNPLECANQIIRSLWKNFFRIP